MPDDETRMHNGVAGARFVFRTADWPTLDLDTMKGTAVKMWRIRWESCYELSGLVDEQPRKKLQVLYMCLAPNTLNILQNIAPDVEDVMVAIDELMKHADGLTNIFVERKKLFERRQRQGEPIQDFVIALRNQVKNCKYCNKTCEDNAVATGLVLGLLDAHTVEAILAITNPTIETIIATAKAREAAAAGRQAVQKTNYEENQLDEFQIARINNHKFKNKKGNGCSWCGDDRRHKRLECPASSATCRACGKRGHFAQVCRSNLGNKEQVPSTRDNVAVVSADLGAGQLTMTSSQAAQQSGYQNDDEWLFNPNLRLLRVCEGQLVQAQAPTMLIGCAVQKAQFEAVVMPDTGADVSAADMAFVRAIGCEESFRPAVGVTPKSADGTVIEASGWVRVTWSLGALQVQDDVLVVEGATTPLLAYKVVRELGLLAPHFPTMRLPPIVRPVHHLNEWLIPEQQHPYATQIRTTHLDEGNPNNLKVALLKAFSDVFSDDIKVMRGETFHIHLEENAKPFCLRTPRNVPLPMREPLRHELTVLQQKGIIEPVTKVTEWCSPVVLEKKPKGGVRVCVDFTNLNKYVKRERYQSDPPAVLVADIPSECKYFSTLDATKGYHQVPLDDQSKDLTTFITPFGRFRYLRAPFGISSISEHYNRRMDEALKDVQHHKRQVDDILLYSKSIKEQYEVVRRLLQTCRERKITLSPSKFTFAETTVLFAGFQISKGTYSIDPSIISAISQFPAPRDVKQLRSFFGLVNQVGFANDGLAKALTPLRPLLSTKNEFIWDDNTQVVFENVKSLLCTSPNIAFYQLGRPMRMSTDASREGLGFLLQQQQKDLTWKTVQAGSRMLAKAEVNYAVIELEMLAVCFAFRKADMFIRGGADVVQVMTDHKPLVNIINSKRLDEISNPRLLRLKQSLMPYHIRAEYVPGSKNVAADALSRAPAQSAPSETLVSAIHIRPQGFDQHRTAELHRKSRDDEEYQTLWRTVREGFPPNKNQTSVLVRPYWPVRHDLSIHDNIIFCGTRVVIPKAMRRSILEKLHAGHQGATRTAELARQVVYWPRIDGDVRNMVEDCPLCQRFLSRNTSQPLIQHVRPVRPGEQTAADFFEVNGMQYLVISDVFSNWFEVAPMVEATAKATIEALDVVWARIGLPMALLSDGGPQFTAHVTQAYLQQKNVRHITSAPAYPQSNGYAESIVKTAKRLVIKCTIDGRLDEHKFSEGLRQIRNTPSVRDGLSPAQKLYGRPIVDETTLHQRSVPLVTPEQQNKARERAKAYDSQTKSRYDRHTRTLPEISRNDRVLVFNNRTKCFDSKAIVLDVHGRRCKLRTRTGIMYRDRVHLRRVPRLQSDEQSRFVTSLPAQLATPQHHTDAENSSTEESQVVNEAHHVDEVDDGVVLGPESQDVQEVSDDRTHPPVEGRDALGNGQTGDEGNMEEPAEPRGLMSAIASIFPMQGHNAQRGGHQKAEDGGSVLKTELKGRPKRKCGPPKFYHDEFD